MKLDVHVCGRTIAQRYQERLRESAVNKPHKK